MLAVPEAVFMVRNESALSNGSFTKFVVTPWRVGDASYGSRDCASPITTAAFTPTPTRVLRSASLCWMFVKLVVKKLSASLSAVFKSATVDACSFATSLNAPKAGPCVLLAGIAPAIGA